MSEFNDTVRLSELPMLAEGDNWQEMTTLGVDGDGRSVQVPLGAVMETVVEDHKTTAETGRRVSALAGQLCPPLRLTMDRKGLEAALGGAAEDTGVPLPDRFTVRLSHKPCERNAGKQQRLEYSTDGGKTWNPFEPAGVLTLSPEDQAAMEGLLAAIAADGYAEMEGRHGTHRFKSEEDVAEYFETRRNERVDIEVAADGRLLLRGKCQTLEGFNITTTAATAAILPPETKENYTKGRDRLLEALEKGKPFWMVFVASEKGGNGIPVLAKVFGSQQEAEAYCDETKDRTWTVTSKAEFEAMWDEFRTAVEVTVPFVCGGDILSLMDWETPDPEAAREVPFAFAGLFEKSTIAVGPELPAVLGEGTWAKLYRDCDHLREVGACWSISEWVRMARSGIGKTFPTYKWLDGAFKNIDEPVLRLEWEEAAPRLLDEVDAMSGKEKASLTGGCMVRPLPTGDVLEKRVDEMQETVSSMGEYLGEMERSVRAGQKIANFWLPKMTYDTENRVVSWNPADNYAGYSVGGQYCTVQEICFWVVGADGLLLGTNGGASFVTGEYKLPTTGPVKRIYAIGVANMSGYDVYTSPVLVYDEGLHSKEEIMSWVGVVFHYKGHKATVADLPEKDNEVGDTWNVRSTGANYAWDGQEWDKLSETVDLSGVAMSADLSAVATSGSYNDLTDKPAIPAAQEQADWSQSDPAAADYIKNKPTIPAAGSQVHQVTAAELAAAQTGGTVTTGDWYFVTDAGSRSLSLGLDATTVLTIWTEQV